jgi:hypothetical protein
MEWKSIAGMRFGNRVIFAIWHGEIRAFSWNNTARTGFRLWISLHPFLQRIKRPHSISAFRGPTREMVTPHELATSDSLAIGRYGMARKNEAPNQSS